jgi:hypothetical protein
MQRLLPNWVVGVVIGFGIGILAWAGLRVFGLDLPGLGSLTYAALGAICGAFVGGHRGTVARWCAALAAVGGAIGFALGFVGTRLLLPDSPPGPLLSILVTGPWGVCAGALFGVVVGVVRQQRRPDASDGRPWDR